MSSIQSIQRIGVLFVLMSLPFAVSASVDRSLSGEPAVKPGIEVLLEEPEFLALVTGKRVGLITNPTGVDHQLRSTIDLLHQHPDITLAALYGPEHGVRGDVYAGDKVADATDERTGVPVFSLYGATRRPTPEMLEGIDVMIYDIQDVGSRSYTFIYTMAYGMEACGEAGIPFLVLDRPNPAGANIVDGNILNPEFSSFVGLYAIPYQYGMTPGEVALMFNAEFNSTACELTVVPMRGYTRDMWQWHTGLPFVPPSNHIPRADVATYYNLTGIIGEIRHISIGVGYTLPFETLAAPWIDRYALTEALTELNLPGLLFRPISYQPRYGAFGPAQGRAAETCHGVQIFITDYNAVRPVTAQIHMMVTLQRLFPDSGLFTDEHAGRTLFDKVMGTDIVRQQVLAGASAEEILAGFEPALSEFMATRAKYLMYE